MGKCSLSRDEEIFTIIKLRLRVRYTYASKIKGNCFALTHSLSFFRVFNAFRSLSPSFGQRRTRKKLNAAWKRVWLTDKSLLCVCVVVGIGLAALIIHSLRASWLSWISDSACSFRHDSADRGRIVELATLLFSQEVHSERTTFCGTHVNYCIPKGANLYGGSKMIEIW